MPMAEDWVYRADHAQCAAFGSARKQLSEFSAQF